MTHYRKLHCLWFINKANCKQLLADIFCEVFWFVLWILYSVFTKKQLKRLTKVFYLFFLYDWTTGSSENCLKALESIMNLSYSVYIADNYKLCDIKTRVILFRRLFYRHPTHCHNNWSCHDSGLCLAWSPKQFWQAAAH